MNMNTVAVADRPDNYEMVARNDIENPPPPQQELSKLSNSWKATGKHSISWNKLSWEVDVKSMGSAVMSKQILKDVSGYVESGNV